MPSLDHVNIQTVKLAETVQFYRDVLDLAAGNPPPPLDPALVQWMFDPDGRAIFHLSNPARSTPSATSISARTPAPSTTSPSTATTMT